MRRRLGDEDYQELVQALRWCQEKGMAGMAQFYDELLTDHLKRRTLPKDVQRRIEEADVAGSSGGDEDEV